MGKFYRYYEDVSFYKFLKAAPWFKHYSEGWLLCDLRKMGVVLINVDKHLYITHDPFLNSYDSKSVELPECSIRITMPIMWFMVKKMHKNLPKIQYVKILKSKCQNFVFSVIECLICVPRTQTDYPVLQTTGTQKKQHLQYFTNTLLANIMQQGHMKANH